MINMILEGTNITAPGAIVLTIAAVIIAGLLIFLLIKGVKRQQFIIEEDKSVLLETMISKPRMREAVNNYVARLGNYGTFSLFYIKIDDYDSLLNVVGEEQTNQVVRSIAERLVRTYKGEATICQFDKDAFLIFDKKEYNYEDLEFTAENLLDLVSGEQGVLKRENIQLTASIGVAIYPSCGNSFKELHQNLELAAYIASRQGGNKFVIYYDELKTEESSNMEYFNEVKNAMSKKELTLYYQPIIDINSKSIYGFEALLRWNHPVHGVISPAKFIPILEQSGDIIQVSRWALEELVNKQIDLKEQFPTKEIKLTFNLSVKQMMSETIVEEFKKVIRKYSADPKMIVLEVDQYAMFEKMNQVKMNILRLRDIGFLISTDGLGLDYSSITQIENKPIDMLKLDREFLKDINENEMQERYVQMLEEFCNKTNKVLVSEGVETYEQLKYVEEQHIEYVQGYYFKEPFPGENIKDYIYSESWINFIEAEPVKEESENKKDSESTDGKAVQETTDNTEEVVVEDNKAETKDLETEKEAVEESSEKVEDTQE